MTNLYWPMLRLTYAGDWGHSGGAVEAAHGPLVAWWKGKRQIDATNAYVCSKCIHISFVVVCLYGYLDISYVYTDTSISAYINALHTFSCWSKTTSNQQSKFMPSSFFFRCLSNQKCMDFSHRKISVGNFWYQVFKVQVKGNFRDPK